MATGYGHSHQTALLLRLVAIGSHPTSGPALVVFGRNKFTEDVPNVLKYHHTSLQHI